MRNIETRIARLEAEHTMHHAIPHLVYVSDCRLDDEAHNEAQRRKALEANPPPEGAQIIFVEFVAPRHYAEVIPLREQS